MHITMCAQSAYYLWCQYQADGWSMSNSVLCVVCKVFVFKFLDSNVYCVNPLDYCEMILLPVTSLAKYVFVPSYQPMPHSQDTNWVPYKSTHF